VQGPGDREPNDQPRDHHDHDATPAIVALLATHACEFYRGTHDAQVIAQVIGNGKHTFGLAAWGNDARAKSLS
jgi:hypothetical protein